MTHEEHVALIRDAVAGASGVWADLGSGEGAFTLALADLAEPGTTIYSIDTNARSLAVQVGEFSRMFPDADLRTLPGDFTDPLDRPPYDLPPLDGLLMANSLHFLKNREAFLRTAAGYLKPGGSLVIVEYDADTGNTWVPYPFSYPRFKEMAYEAGFGEVRKTGSVPSRFMNAIYSARAILPAFRVPDSSSG